VVPAGDVFAALIQTANSLEVSALVAGEQNRRTAEDQAYHLGQAWEALPEPKRQIAFYVVSPDGNAKVFSIGPHAPNLRADDVQLVHRLWLNFRRDPGIQDLHHGDIVTYALTRLAREYARDKQEVLRELGRFKAQPPAPRGLGTPTYEDLARRENDYSIRAPHQNPGS
jgi:hypothetical protein